MNTSFLLPLAVFSLFSALNVLNGKGVIHLRGWPFSTSDEPRAHFRNAALCGLYATGCVVLGVLTR